MSWNGPTWMRTRIPTHPSLQPSSDSPSLELENRYALGTLEVYVSDLRMWVMMIGEMPPLSRDA